MTAGAIQSTEVAEWTDSLNRTVSELHGLFKRVIVLHETDSTQDAARRMNAEVGDLVVAGRQKHGRGRLGRNWHDTADHGVAMTLIAPRDQPERLAIASAVGACLAIEHAAGWRFRRRLAIKIKWPNDIVFVNRKIAGVLVEQVNDRALIGIGVNVSQFVWPAELANRALSLAQLGIQIDRLAVMQLLLQSVQSALAMSDPELTDFFNEHNALLGAMATFLCDNRRVSGRVIRIDPMRGLTVATTDQGELSLPAATTSVIDWQPPPPDPAAIRKRISTFQRRRSIK